MNTSGKNRVVILFFHPLYHKSRVNSKMLHEVMETEGITTRVMYDIYPDFHIDLKREQEVLLEHDIIIWQHPFYWYSSPSLLKEWIDIVLEHGFAFGKHGTALEGKKVMTAISSGGSREVYQEGGARGYSIRQLLLPFRQTAALCRMEYLPPFVVHGTHLLDEKGIAKAANLYKETLLSLRDGRVNAAQWREVEYMNDLIS